MAILFGCHGKKEICKAPAGKEDPVKYQQGKILLYTSRESRPCYAPAGKEDPVVHEQGKKTLLNLSLVWPCIET